MTHTDTTKDELAFIRESNAIEGIHRDPTPEEIAEFQRFMALDDLTIEELERFVSVYQPGAKIRDKPGMDVMVGGYTPPGGGRFIAIRLVELLFDAEEEPGNAYSIHLAYEQLHPFTDGNGRSGRMLWAWMHHDLRRGFLHEWYYQALRNAI